MDELAALKPVREDHAIKEAVISIFFAGPIIKPKRFQKLIETDFKDKFHHYETVNGFQVQLDARPQATNQFQHEVTPDIGFRFVRFAHGVPTLALQGMNEKDRNYISIHALDYKRWENFINDFNEVFAVLSKHLANMFVVGFGLNYRDEFLWESNSEIPVSKIFQEDSSLLPKKFFSNLASQLILTSEEKNEHRNLFDRLEINVGKNLTPNILISHNVVESLQSPEELSVLLEEKVLSTMLNTAHEDNKTVLKSVLTKPVQDLIKLK